MIEVVIDTHVVVSANLVDAGPSAAILDLAVYQQVIRMCISPAGIGRIRQSAAPPPFKLTTAKIEGSLALIISAARMDYPTKTLNISDDESDNRFYECAEAAAADYLITGNTQDFTQDHGATRIIMPRDFLDQIASRLL